MEIAAMQRLIAKFKSLPGVGLKTATRFAYSIVEGTDSEAEEFSNAILCAKNEVHFCSECGNYTDLPVCGLCKTRDRTQILVVAEPKDVAAFERAGGYKGVYHVLHGTIDFQKGVGVDDIRMKELMARLTDVKEVILATNPDISGELTASYIANQLKPLGIAVTRLAYGISVGSEIEYADELTLQRALQDRKKL